MLSSGHNTVIEHAYFTVAFNDVSVLTEQLMIEHRLAAYTVKSRRYVDFTGAGYVIPELSDESEGVYTAHMDYLFGVYTKLLEMDESYADRDLNVGFSGGEKKKAEILQLLMLKPRLAILDETDSGLDVDAVRTVSAGIKAYQEEIGGALIIITHITRILQSLKVDQTHVLVNGRLVTSGGADLVDEITASGFEKYENL